MNNKRKLQDFDVNEKMDSEVVLAVANSRAPYPDLVKMYLSEPYMVNQLLRPSVDNFEDLAEFTSIMRNYVSFDIVQQVWLGVSNLKNGMFTISSLGVDYASFVFYFFRMYFHMKEKRDCSFKESEMYEIIGKYDKKMLKNVELIMEKLVLYQQIRDTEKTMLVKEETIPEKEIEEILDEEFLGEQFYTCKLISQYCDHTKESVIEDLNVLEKEYIPIFRYEYDAISVFLEKNEEDITVLNQMKGVNRKCYDKYRRYVYSKVVRYKIESMSTCFVHNKRKCRICRRRLARRGDYISPESHMFQIVNNRNNLYHEIYNSLQFPESRTYFVHSFVKGLLRFTEFKIRNKKRYHMCKCGYDNMMRKLKPYFLSEVLHKTRCLSTVVFNERKMSSVMKFFKSCSVYKKVYGKEVCESKDYKVFDHEIIGEKLFNALCDFKGERYVSGVYCGCHNKYRDYKRPLDLFKVYKRTYRVKGEVPDKDDLNADFILVGCHEDNQSFYYKGLEIDDDNSSLLVYSDNEIKKRVEVLRDGMFISDEYLVDGSWYTVDELMDDSIFK